MAKTVIQGFQTLSSWLEITDKQATKVSERQLDVRDIIASEIGLIDHFLTGSYKRDTLIAPLSLADVDIFCVLESRLFDDYRNGGQATLLDRVKRILQRTYTTTGDISRDGQAVTISFSEFKVDVVPAFNAQGGGYLIPNSITKQWIRTDPKRHIDLWVKANNDHSGDLVPLIKMIKCWKREANVPLSSFLLECIILQVLTNIRISDFLSGIRYVFDKAREAIKNSVPDPAGYNPDVAQYIRSQGKVDEIVGKLETALTRARNAEEAVNRGNIEEAFRCWGLIFGSYFPAY